MCRDNKNKTTSKRSKSQCLYKNCTDLKRTTIKTLKNHVMLCNVKRFCQVWLKMATLKIDTNFVFAFRNITK